MRKNEEKSSNDLGGFLGAVERIGNKLPHPAILFLLICLLVVLLSAVFQGVSETYFDAQTGQDVTVEVVSLLSVDGLRYMMGSMASNFAEFPTLGTVLVAMLGVGVAEHSNFINTALKKLLMGVNPTFMTAIVIFAGIMSNVASDAGYVVVIPLGALIFANSGRHPLAGLAAAFAGVSAGFSANLLVGALDPMISGITNLALESAHIDASIAPSANWYFLMASTFVLTIVGTFVSEHIVEKNLGTYTGDFVADEQEVTALETKGLKYAGLSLIIFFILLGILTIPSNAIFKTPEVVDGVEMMTLDWFLNNALIPVIFLGFLVPGVVYGRVVGNITSGSDVIEYMTTSMKDMASLLVLVFFISQFVGYFNYSNLGLIVSVKGASFLESIGLTGLPLMVGFVFVCAFINLFMGGAVTKWAVMAPIFVPMMYELGLSPAATQVAYRIGDSATNVITPLMSFFALIVVFMQDYDEDAGLGTLISTMLPYSGFFLVAWTLLLILWYFLKLPLGPGAYMFV